MGVIYCSVIKAQQFVCPSTPFFFPINHTLTGSLLQAQYKQCKPNGGLERSNLITFVIELIDYLRKITINIFSSKSKAPFGGWGHVAINKQTKLEIKFSIICKIFLIKS